MLNTRSLGHNKTSINTNTCIDFLFFLYLCFPLLRLVFTWVLSPIGLEALARTIIICVMVFLFLILCLKKRRLLVPDFWLMFFLIAIFFAFSYLAHPENAYWFEREDYGALNYVFRPDNGLFIYLFIRLINDPNRILKTVKLAGWPMYLYYGRQLMQAVARGYWIDTDNRGYEIHMSYNLSLGYNALIFVLVFLYCALEEKKPLDWIGAAVGLFIILAGGSRGPFLDIGIFFLICSYCSCSYFRQHISRPQTPLILVGFNDRFCSFAILIETG